jgi:ribosome-binding protein aMBF1 (putative translation factor)
MTSFDKYLQSKKEANPELADLIEEASINSEIAQQVHDLRTAAGLLQKDLAARIGTKQSVISRIEDSDYRSHSISLLRRIAKAFNKKLRVYFTDDGKKPYATVSTITVGFIGTTNGPMIVMSGSPYEPTSPKPRTLCLGLAESGSL